MKVELLHNTPLKIADIAIGTCWDKQRGDNIIDIERMERVANKFKHASTIEHITYNFYISGVSRALLQEQARHRMANISVKSTRYTLKEIKKENIDWFNAAGGITDEAYNLVEKYCVLPKDLLFEDEVKFKLTLANSLGAIAHSKLDNDKIKYMLPEAYKTEFTWTCNARALQNFLHLRTSSAALWEIRDLANEIYNQLPEDHKFLYTKIVEDNKDDN